MPGRPFLLTLAVVAGLAYAPAWAQKPLRDAAAERALLAGAAADYSYLGQSDYTTVLGREYSVLEPENDMKWATIHPRPPGSANEYNFVPGDALVAFANAHNMLARGHNLCWYSYNPSWLASGNYTADQLNQIFHDHISTVVGHYAGQVFAWDVVNEALDDSGQLRDSIWYNQPGIGQTGFGYIVQAFQWAHQADPKALLFYNDYNVEDAATAKSTAMYNMLKTLLAQGVPVHGAGLQLHVTTSSSGPTIAGLDANIARLTALGLQVHLTELDVRIPVDSNGQPSPADLQAQAQRYHDIAAVCLKYPGCTLIQTWGFTDKYSWVPSSFPGWGAALPFDAQYQPKPAYDALQQLFASTPPVLSAAGVVNAASYQGGAVSPGEIVTVFGANFGPSSLVLAQFDSSGRLPSSLDGTQILFDGTPAPVIYAAVNQTTVIVPFSVAGRSSTMVTYSYGGVQSAPVPVPVSPAAPGIFAANASGSGPGAILNQDYSLNTASNPAEAGSVVQVFGTGGGAVVGSIADGQIVGLPLPALGLNVTATVGGRTAKTTYSGPAPLEVAGMLQVNVEIPSGLSSGPQPLVITVGTFPSQGNLTVAVK